MIDWKDVSKSVCEIHEQVGGCVLPLFVGGFTGDILVNLTPPLAVDGSKFNARKDLRRWIHKVGERKRMFQRANAVVWSIYDGEKSYFGVGATVPVSVAVRLNKRNPSVFMVSDLRQMVRAA